MNISSQDVCRRVAEIRRDACGVRGKADFARQLQLSPSTYSYYERSRIPPADVLARMAELTGVRLEWLLTGQGAKYGPEPQGSPVQEIQSAVQELLRNHPQLAVPLRAFVSLLQEVALLPQEAAASATRSLPGMPRAGELIPVVGRTAAGPAHFWSELATEFDPQKYDRKIEQVLFAGQTKARQAASLETVSPLRLKDRQVALVQMSAPDEAGLVEFLASPALKHRYPDAVAWRIDGDSMSPQFEDGDLVVGTARVPAQPGQPCIARLRDQIGVTCKIYQPEGNTVALVPVNASHVPARYAQGQLEWAVAVIASVRWSQSGGPSEKTSI